MTSSSRHGPRSTITGEMDDEAARTEEWRSMLTGENDTLTRLRRYWKLLPSSPRCKVCAAPFHGPGKLATSIILHGQSKLNPMLCGITAKGVRVGVGVQTGTAFVGVLGIDEKLDFTALGDTVNVAARLGSMAGPGELLVSRTAWEAAALPLDEAARREIEISGREGLLEVVVDRPGLAVATTAA